MNRAALEKAAPWAPAFFLLVAVAAGGLRQQQGWLLFGALLLAWRVLRPAALTAAGLKAPPLFFGWLLAAALFAPDPGAALGYFSRTALLGLFFFGALSYRDGARCWLAALYALGAAAAAVFLFQRLSGSPPIGLIGANPNYSAVFCAAALPAALLALSDPAAGRRRALYAPLALLLVAGLAASGSRGAVLAALLSAGAGLAWLRRWAWLAGLLAALTAAALLVPGGLAEFLKLGDARAYERPRLWGAALQAALASPLLGWGQGQFGGVFEFFKFPYADGVSYFGHSTLHAHSEPLNLAAEAGLPAALLFLAAAAAALARGWKTNLPLALAALAALLQGGADMIFYSGAVGLLYWGSLGFCAAGEAPAGDGSAARALAALFLTGLLALPAGDAPAARSFMAAAELEATAGGNRALAVALARHDAAARPRSAFAAADEGAALAAAGDLAAAGAAFTRALELEPAFSGARLGLAGVYSAAGRYPEACAAAEGLEAYSAAGPSGEYERLLLGYDRPAAERFRKELCGKKKIGSATASPRRTSSRATK
ncbi:MAG: O-antigen ligase family protein [Elusimicrobiales bacterium]